tara:strand:+ start:324 stop:605 length:282 start_codon:yes stop_codon:yes gene_type:complete
MDHIKADPAKLAVRLRGLRKERGTSLEKLSRQLALEYGLERSRQNLHQHETGIRIPSSQAVAGYCRIYNLNTADARELFELAGYVVVFATEEA